MQMALPFIFSCTLHVGLQELNRSSRGAKLRTMTSHVTLEHSICTQTIDFRALSTCFLFHLPTAATNVFEDGQRVEEAAKGMCR